MVLFMRKILCLLILLTAFYSEVAAYDFSAISYVTVENGVKAKSSSGYFESYLRLEKGDFGKGYMEDVLCLKVVLDEHTGIGGWYQSCMCARSDDTRDDASDAMLHPPRMNRHRSTRSSENE